MRRTPVSGDGVLVLDPHPVCERVFRRMGWRAGRTGDTYRLAGGTVDLRPAVVTDLTVDPGSLKLDTTIPVFVPVSRRAEANRLCGTLNALLGGPISITQYGAPGLSSKIILLGPESHAAGLIVDGVRSDRGFAEGFVGLFLQIAEGASAVDVAHNAGLDRDLPAHAPVPVAAQLDFTEAPEPIEEYLEEARALRITEAEALAFAHHQALIIAIYEAHGDDAPFCPGPLLFHADGVAECWNCEQPEATIHPSGCTASCRKARRLGKGHSCERCGPP